MVNKSVRSDQSGWRIGRCFAGAACAAVLLVLSSSCGDDPETGEVDTEEIPTDAVENPGQAGCVLHCEMNLGVLTTLPDDICEAMAAADVAYYQRCASNISDLLGGSGPDSSTYQTVLSEWCKASHFLEGLDGQPVWDDTVRAGFRECLLSWANAPCGCPVSCEMTDVVLGTGQLPDGAPCRQGTQCRGGMCAADELWGCGVCASYLGDAAAGEPCEYVGDCASALYCDEVDGTCMPAKQACDTCVEDIECENGLSCIRGECAFSYLEEGAACEEGHASCAGNLECRPEGENGAWICTRPYYQYNSTGEPCNTSITGSVAGETTCNLLNSCSAEEDGVCVALGLAGDPCTVDTNGESDCFMYLICENGTCAYPNPTCN